MKQKVWGGFLFENVVQATARDLFMWQVLRLVDAGLPPCLRVHDEAVVLVDEGDAEDARAAVEGIMSSRPGWAEGLPVAAEAKIVTRYNEAK